MIQSELANSAKPKESFYFLLLIDLIVLAGNKSTEENRQFKFSLFKGILSRYLRSPNIQSHETAHIVNISQGGTHKGLEGGIDFLPEGSQPK